MPVRIDLPSAKQRNPDVMVVDGIKLHGLRCIVRHRTKQDEEEKTKTPTRREDQIELKTNSPAAESTGFIAAETIRWFLRMHRSRVWRRRVHMEGFLPRDVMAQCREITTSCWDRSP